MYNVYIRSEKPMPKQDIITGLQYAIARLIASDDGTVKSWTHNLVIDVQLSLAPTHISIGAWVRKGLRVGRVIDTKTKVVRGDSIPYAQVDWRYARSEPTPLSTTWVRVITIKQISSPDQF